MKFLHLIFLFIGFFVIWVGGAILYSRTNDEILFPFILIILGFILLGLSLSIYLSEKESLISSNLIDQYPDTSVITLRSGKIVRFHEDKFEKSIYIYKKNLPPIQFGGILIASTIIPTVIIFILFPITIQSRVILSLITIIGIIVLIFGFFHILFENAYSKGKRPRPSDRPIIEKTQLKVNRENDNFKIISPVFITGIDGSHDLELIVTKETLNNAKVFSSIQFYDVTSTKLNVIAKLLIFINQLLKGKIYYIAIRPKDNKYSLLSNTPMNFDIIEYLVLHTCRNQNEANLLLSEIKNWMVKILNKD